MKVPNIVQEAVIKTISRKNKCKNAKWLTEKNLKMAENRAELKTKEKIHPSEIRVPKIARRGKKTFLSEQCKKIEENNRVRKTRDLFKKIRDTKGTFHAKMGTIKDKNGMDLTEAEDIKKR